MSEISHHTIPFGDFVAGWNNADLAEKQLHIWFFKSELNTEQLAICTSFLQDEEHKKAAFYLDPLVQSRYIVSRAMLRLLIHLYTGKELKDVALTANELGKPILKSGEIHFNLSHSGGWIGIAFCRNKEVGLDLELRRELHDFEQMIQVNFTSDEQAFIAFGMDGFENRFFDLWCIKESFLKATGTGMRIDPSWISTDFEQRQVKLNVPTPFTKTPFLPYQTIAFDKHYSAALSYHADHYLSSIYTLIT